jgi:hypothetical protein
MGFFNTFHFDEDKYYREHCNLSTDVLHKKHYQKVMLLATTTGGVAIGVGGVVVTGGVSLFSVAYSGRQHSVAKQQKEILEKIMEEQDIKIPWHQKRNIAGGTAIAVTSLSLAVGAHEVWQNDQR